MHSGLIISVMAIQWDLLIFFIDDMGQKVFLLKFFREECLLDLNEVGNKTVLIM